VHANAEAQKKPDSVVTARTPAPAPKLVKQPVQPHRPQKLEQPALVEAKPRAVERPERSPVQSQMPLPPSAAADAAGKAAGQSAATGQSPAGPSGEAGPGRDGSGANRGEEDRPLFARLKLVPSWFSSGNDRADERVNDRPVNVVPRPPMPVGEPPRGTM
jgi:hypothetical protein